jgi:hypothetical protein
LPVTTPDALTAGGGAPGVPGEPPADCVRSRFGVDVSRTIAYGAYEVWVGVTVVGTS